MSRIADSKTLQTLFAMKKRGEHVGTNLKQMIVGNGGEPRIG